MCTCTCTCRSKRVYNWYIIYCVNLCQMNCTEFPYMDNHKGNMYTSEHQSFRIISETGSTMISTCRCITRESQ